MGKKPISLTPSAWVYCFKRGSKAVFLNRKDETIKEFDSYEEAIQFAEKNIQLIDISHPKGIKLETWIHLQLQFMP